MEDGNFGDNIVIQKFKEISETDTLGKALSLFENSTDILVVLNQKKKYSGILIERSILRTDLDPRKSKVKSFTTRAPKLKTPTEIVECARLMIENNVFYLPVFKDAKIIGLITYLDILKSPLLQKFVSRTVRDVMVRNLPRATPEDRIGSIYKKFKRSDIFSIPVVENEKLVGMVNLHDTIHALLQHRKKPDFGTKLGEKEHLLDLPIRNIMAPQIKSLPDSASIGDVIDTITENKLDCLTIIDDNNFIQSIITVKDLLRLITTQKEVYILPKIRINSKIEGLNRQSVTAAINAFVKKYSSVLSPSEFEVYMREHKEKQKHQKLIYTRIQAFAHKDNFAATAEGFGVDHSIKEALDKLERQVRKKKTAKKHGGR